MQFHPSSAASLSALLIFSNLIQTQIEGFNFAEIKRNGGFNYHQSFCSNYPRSTSSSCWLFSRGDNYDNKDELLRAAQDPKLFEEYVLKKMNKNKLDEEANSVPGMANDHSQQIDEDNKLKKGGYVSIEEWDGNRSKDDLSWEERVQYDGQKYGNRVYQNEILRKNLKTW